MDRAHASGLAPTAPASMLMLGGGALDADQAGGGAEPEDTPVPESGTKSDASEGFSGAAFALSALVIAGLTGWWLRGSHAAHFYDRYYRIAAVLLVAAILAALALGIVLYFSRPRPADAAGGASLDPPSPPGS